MNKITSDGDELLQGNTWQYVGDWGRWLGQVEVSERTVSGREQSAETSSLCGQRIARRPRCYWRAASKKNISRKAGQSSH